MNGVPEYYEVKMKQTSKGIWYCDGFTASTEDMGDSISAADVAMRKIEMVLKAHNAAEQPIDVDKWTKGAMELQKEINANKSLKEEGK